MIAHHSQFLAAIGAKRKVRLRYYSQTDTGVQDRVCAPLDFGPGDGLAMDGLDRYWLWDYAGNPDARALGLLPPEIVELSVLDEILDPAEFSAHAWPWSVARDWNSLSQADETKTDLQPDAHPG
jgi:hypothetical protein